MKSDFKVIPLAQDQFKNYLIKDMSMQNVSNTGMFVLVQIEMIGEMIFDLPASWRLIKADTENETLTFRRFYQAFEYE